MTDSAARFAEEVDFRSPFGAALERYPDLVFRDPQLFVGAGSLTLRYVSSFGGRNREAAETMALDGTGRAHLVLCAYAEDRP